MTAWLDSCLRRYIQTREEKLLSFMSNEMLYLKKERANAISPVAVIFLQVLEKHCLKQHVARTIHLAALLILHVGVCCEMPRDLEDYLGILDKERASNGEKRWHDGSLACVLLEKCVPTQMERLGDCISFLEDYRRKV